MIPSLMAGSAVTGAISMAIGAELKVPHGGIFVLPIPGAVTHLLGYVAALIAGTLVSALAIGLLKRRWRRRNRKGCATAVATRVRPAWQHVSSGSAQQWKIYGQPDFCKRGGVGVNWACSNLFGVSWG